MVNPYHCQGNIVVYHGDCRAVLASLMDMRFSTIITDPPYGLKFMGKVWDHGVPGEVFWKRFAMLCHPGAMLLSFGGTRAWHRLAVAIEDAGWEIRDTLMWVYGSGFPKSANISKNIDKAAGAERKIVGRNLNVQGRNDGGIWGDGIERPWKDRVRSGEYDNAIITAPAAQLWDGYGTALKPAFEPIILAMNPLDGTYANNALKHGVAGLNVDGGRVEFGDSKEEKHTKAQYARQAKSGARYFNQEGTAVTFKYDKPAPQGRWPANLIHDGSEEVLEVFARVGERKTNLHAQPKGHWAKSFDGSGKQEGEYRGYGDSVSAARFFYCAKASRAERTCGGKVDNRHPTVKPLSLMEYLCKLTMMPTDADLVLDPFMGSGSTLIACARLGRPAIGIDSDEAACEIAAKRLQAETK